VTTGISQVKPVPARVPNAAEQLEDPSQRCRPSFGPSERLLQRGESDRHVLSCRSPLSSVPRDCARVVVEVSTARQRPLERRVDGFGYAAGPDRNRAPLYPETQGRGVGAPGGPAVVGSDLGRVSALR